MADYHGWVRHDNYNVGKEPSLHVGKLPNRKRTALYESNGSVTILAYFKDEESAQRTIKLIDWLTAAKDKSEVLR